MIHTMNKSKYLFLLLLFSVANNSLAFSNEEMENLALEQFGYMSCKFIADNLDTNSKGNPIIEMIQSRAEFTKVKELCKEKYPELFKEPNFLIKSWKSMKDFFSGAMDSMNFMNILTPADTPQEET